MRVKFLLSNKMNYGYKLICDLRKNILFVFDKEDHNKI